MAQNFDLKTLSVTELKALSYDFQILLAQTQQNIQVIAQELKSRTSATSPTASQEAVKDDKASK